MSRGHARAHGTETSRQDGAHDSHRERPERNTALRMEARHLLRGRESCGSRLPGSRKSRNRGLHIRYPLCDLLVETRSVFPRSRFRENTRARETASEREACHIRECQ